MNNQTSACSAPLCLRMKVHCALFLSALQSIYKNDSMPRVIKHAVCLNTCGTTSTPISVYYHRKTLNAFCTHATGHNATKRERGPNLIGSIERGYWEVSEEVLMHIYGDGRICKWIQKVCGLAEEACTPVSCCGCALYLISLWERHTLQPYLYPHSQSLQFLASLELEQGLLEQQRERDRERGLRWAQSGTHLSGQSVSVPDNGELA